MEIVQRDFGNGAFLVDLELDSLEPPEWTLRPLDEQVVAELERSIQNCGMLQPIVVRMRKERYEVVFGNHRLVACKRLGLKRIRAIVKEFSDEEAFLARVSENLVRNSYVDPLEEARGYKMLVAKGWSINAIGRKVGKCDSYISERLALLENLSPTLQSQVSRGMLTPSHAELLSRIKDKNRQAEVAELVEKNRWSVRSLEAVLNGVPPPIRTQMISMRGEYYVKIPKEFADAIDFHVEKSLFMYVRGGKLILDDINRSRNRKRSNMRKSILGLGIQFLCP